MEGGTELTNQEETAVKSSENGIDTDEKSTENDDEDQTTTTSRVPYNLTIEENDIDSETVVKMKGDAIGMPKFTLFNWLLLNFIYYFR